MKEKPIWTLEGKVLEVMGRQELSLADRMVVSGICKGFEKEFVNGPGDHRHGPDYQEADVVIKILAKMGYEIPPGYEENQEQVLVNLIGNIRKEGGKEDIDAANRAFLNRRSGRIFLEREGD